MGMFMSYLDSSTSVEELLFTAFTELYLSDARQKEILVFLDVLKIRDVATYEHSIRVGLLARKIARFMHLDEKVQSDTEEIQNHVLDGYRLLRGKFDFSAEIILWHHKFQNNGYPKQLPVSLHPYSEGTKTIIAFFGRILALADCFDALHRFNDRFWNGQKFGGEQVKERMLVLNSDCKVLIEELYGAGIFIVYVCQ